MVDRDVPSSAEFAGTSVGDFFEQRAKNLPAAPAVEYEGHIWTYGALNSVANQIAHTLRDAGAAPGCSVAVLMQSSPWQIAALLAVMKAGCAYIPLDRDQPEARLTFILGEAQPAIVIADDDVRIGDGKLRVLRRSELVRQAQSSDCGNPQLTCQPDDLCYIIYTSGSTGTPKGVAVSHRAVLNTIAAFQSILSVSSRDRWLTITVASFDIAALEWWLPLYSGATIVLVNRAVARDGVRLRKRLEVDRITILQGTPATWRLVLSAGGIPKPLRLALCGGDALSAELANQLTAVDALDVWNLYGPTEATIWCTAERLTGRRFSTPPPIGRAIAGTTAYVVGDNMELVADGVVGELCIGGLGVAQGYLGRPALTAERFVPDPFSGAHGARLYRTGDWVRRTGEIVEYIGRVDNQIKLRGHRIEIGEIEAALRATCGVEAAAVIVGDDKRGEKQLCAYLVMCSDSPPTLSECKRNLADVLPAYMMPSEWFTIREFPLTTNGKIDRAALSPRHNVGAEDAQSLYTPPQGRTEELIARAWENVLGVSHVGRDDDFFALGGHSLLAVTMILELQETFDVDLTMAVLIDYPTVRSLGKLVDEQSVTVRSR